MDQTAEIYAKKQIELLEEILKELKSQNTVMGVKSTDFATYETLQDAELAIQEGAAKAFEKYTEYMKTIQAPAYDWWRLENGDYAKIYKIELKGTIYKEDGTMVTNLSPTWNPYSLRCKIDQVDKTQFDLKNHKFSVEDKGWPEWTK